MQLFKKQKTFCDIFPGILNSVSNFDLLKKITLITLGISEN